MLCKGEVDKHTRHSGVSGKAAEVFHYDRRYLIRLDGFQHFLKTGSLEVNPGVTVIHEAGDIREMILTGIGFEHHTLVFDGQGLTKSFVLLG